MIFKKNSVCLWIMALCLFGSVLFTSKVSSAQTCQEFAGHYAPAGCTGEPEPPPTTPTPGKPPTPPPKDTPPPVFPPTPPDTPPGTTDPTCKGGSDYNAFKKHLLAREGYRLTVYRDSLGKPTVGVGHLVLPEDNLKVGDTITKEQAEKFLDKDARAAWDAAQKQAKDAGITSSCFAVALGSVSFQLGLGWRTKFPRTWRLIVEGKYAEAAAALNGTIWQKQTPVRVKDFQDALMELERLKKAKTP